MIVIFECFGAVGFFENETVLVTSNKMRHLIDRKAVQFSLSYSSINM